MKHPSYDLTGKVVLITGGTGGIGSATARKAIQQGAKVAIVDISPETPEIAQRMSSHAALGVVADVRDRDAMDRAVAEVVERFGRVDVAIANAGILTRAATLRAMPSSSIESLFAVNIAGVVNTVRATMDQVITNRGQFVLISSVFAFLNGMGTIPYAMSKAAVEQLGRGLRLELAQHGVSTTVAYFSLIDTDLIKRGVDDDAVVVELLGSLPRPFLKRLTPDVAAAALINGISQRAPRVMAPLRWKPVSALRGVLAPALDSRLARDRQTLGVLAELDTRSDLDTKESTMASSANTWKDTPTRTIDVNGTRFAYRELGVESGVPVVFLHHFTAVLDDWDPRVIDGIAAHHRVVAFDNRGIGATSGKVPDTVEQMGTDSVAFIRAMGLEKVDLVGFSLGGGVAQMVALQAPDLVRRMILAGTGPRGGGGIDQMSKIVGVAYAKAFLTRKDPREYLFFPRTAAGKRASSEYLQRLGERTRDRDKKISLQARLAQLKAIVNAGKSAPDDLSVITAPVLVANGDHDLMVDSALSADMAHRLPDATLEIYPESGHGGIFQYHDDFVATALKFLSDD
jgi:NAD(P)-dependent dehydrogenase (short-subunit alcohol dehydrogenase family)/pimeloyl-ACP methyl ester carboxylesterase